MIQSGVGDQDSGRKFGELAALGSAALGFIPTIIVASRHFILWRSTGYFSRKALSDEDLEAEMTIKERLGIKDIKEQRTDKGVKVGGLHAKSLREQQAEKSGRTMLPGGGGAGVVNGSSNAVSIANSPVQANVSFGHNNNNGKSNQTPNSSPLLSNSNSAVKNNNSFGNNASITKNNINLNVRFTKSGTYVYVPPKGVPERDSFLNSSSDEDDDDNKGNNNNNGNAAGSPSPSSEPAFIRDPKIPTTEKLERIFSASRFETEKRERKEEKAKKRKEQLRQHYRVPSDEDVVSVDSLFGVLTKKRPGHLRQENSISNGSLSNSRNNHSNNGQDDDDDL